MNEFEKFRLWAQDRRINLTNTETGVFAFPVARNSWDAWQTASGDNLTDAQIAVMWVERKRVTGTPPWTDEMATVVQFARDVLARRHGYEQDE